MGFLDFLRKKREPETDSAKPARALADNVVVIDNTSEQDNWIINKSGAPVSVACDEMWGSFAVSLRSGETKRVTFNVKANAYPEGQYSYDDLKYKLGKGEKWEVRREQGTLVMVKVSG